MSTSERKLEAAKAALLHLPQSGIVGLGSGSTASLFIAELGKLVAAGRQLTGVATSQDSRQLAEASGIPLLDDAGPWQIDVCVDGADEVSADLNLIKGGGGCQTREKIINDSARFNVIIVDDSKLSNKLGDKWAVPVEVLRFGANTTVRKLEAFGSVTLRLKDGAPWITDSNNLIYDVRTGPIGDPAALDTQLRAIPGVVETGLFVSRADLVLVAGSDGVRQVRR